MLTQMLTQMPRQMQYSPTNKTHTENLLYIYLRHIIHVCVCFWKSGEYHYIKWERGDV